MNGVIVLSTRSGACLFAQSYQDEFGLPRNQLPGNGNSGAAGRTGNGPGGGGKGSSNASSPDALQLAGLLFALDLHAGELVPGKSGGNGGNGGGGGGAGPGRYCSPRHKTPIDSRNKASQACRRRGGQHLPGPGTGACTLVTTVCREAAAQARARARAAAAARRRS